MSIDLRRTVAHVAVGVTIACFAFAVSALADADPVPPGPHVAFGPSTLTAQTGEMTATTHYTVTIPQDGAAARISTENGPVIDTDDAPLSITGTAGVGLPLKNGSCSPSTMPGPGTYTVTCTATGPIGRKPGTYYYLTARLTTDEVDTGRQTYATAMGAHEWWMPRECLDTVVVTRWAPEEPRGRVVTSESYAHETGTTGCTGRPGSGAVGPAWAALKAVVAHDRRSPARLSEGRLDSRVTPPGDYRYEAWASTARCTLDRGIRITGCSEANPVRVYSYVATVRDGRVSSQSWWRG